MVAAVIAAVVGGVVGSRKASTSPASAEPTSSSNNAGGESTAPRASTSSASQASRSSNAPSITTSEIVGPSATIFSVCPSANDTVHTYSQDGSPIGNQLFRQTCNASVPHINNLNVNIFDMQKYDLSDCMDQCGQSNLQTQTSIANGEAHVCNAVCWIHNFDVQGGKENTTFIKLL